MIKTFFGLFLILLSTSALSDTCSVIVETSSALEQAFLDANSVSSSTPTTVCVKSGTYYIFGQIKSKNILLKRYDSASSVVLSPLITDMSNQNTEDASELFPILYVTDSYLIIDGIRFNNGYSQYSGGAINAQNTSMSIKNSIFSNNQAGLTSLTSSSELRPGGAIYFYKGSLAIQNTSLHHNRGQSGGAVHASSTSLIIDNSAFYDNKTFAENRKMNGVGGAIYAFDTSITMKNSTVTNNAASEGGAIYFVQSTVDIRHAFSHNTFSDNVASQGSFLFTSANDAQKNQANFTGNLIDQMFDPCEHRNNAFVGTSKGYNMTTIDLVDTACFAVSTASKNKDLFVSDMKLNELSENEGSTPTIAPRIDSPIINSHAACAADLPRDQRYYPRGSYCDAGAYEYSMNVIKNGDAKNGTQAWFVSYVSVKNEVFASTNNLGKMSQTLSKDLLTDEQKSAITDTSLWSGGVAPKSFNAMVAIATAADLVVTVTDVSGGQVKKTCRAQITSFVSYQNLCQNELDNKILKSWADGKVTIKVTLENMKANYFFDDIRLEIN